MGLKPGYKQTEVGVIPEEWEVKSLGEVGQFKNGINKDKEDFGHGFPFVNLMDVFGIPKVTAAKVDFGLVNSNPAEQKLYELKAGDVLFVRSSVKPDGVGLTTLISEDLPQTVFSGFLIRYRDSGQFATEFKEHCFWQEGFRKRLIAKSTVSANTNINQDALKKLLIAFPPNPEEQRAIAGALGDVDALLAALEKLIAKKRDLKQAAMQQLLTGQKRLPGFSGKWEVKTLGDLFAFSGGYSASRDQLSSEGHCYLHYGDIHKSSKTFIDVRAEYQDIPKLDIPLKRVSASSLLEDGDVVFVDASEDDAGTSKHVVVMNKDKVPFISGLHTIVAKGKTNELAHEYRRYCFQTEAIQRQFLFYAVGIKVSGISKTNIAKLNLPVPPFFEQTAIAEVLSDMDAEIAALEQRLAKTRALKQGMMQELLTGKTRLVDSLRSHEQERI
jgi:type I restriction enzyme, S subunit